jgi:cytosine/adenosine deaminase-related metal-dependent hydrolase
MTLIAADYLLDETSTLRRNWAVRISGSEITGVGPASSLKGESWINLGRAVLMSGFVNCHNHLELTALGPMVHRTNDFVAWLDEVRTLRNSESEGFLAASAREGVAQSLLAGVTTLADHSNSGLSLDALSEMPIRAFILYELIALDKKTFEERVPLYKERIKNTKETPHLSWGLAPHASYSVSQGLFEWTRRVCEKDRRIISIHLHEHKEEAEFLMTGGGGFRQMQERLGANLSDYPPPGLSPTAYLQSLGILRPKTLLIHANYISDEDIRQIKKSGASVVFCPRSHSYFNHTEHPLEKLLLAGVNVSLGTDSLVSNWTLSILDEMRLIKTNYPGVDARTIFKMASANGAEALGLGGKIGKLGEGACADIIALGNLPAKDSLSVDDLLVPEVKNVFTMVDGREVFRKTVE